MEQEGIYVTRPLPFGKDAQKNATDGSDLQGGGGDIKTFLVCSQSAVFWTISLTAAQNGGERRYVRHFRALYKWLAVPQAHSRSQPVSLSSSTTSVSAHSAPVYHQL